MASIKLSRLIAGHLRLRKRGITTAPETGLRITAMVLSKTERTTPQTKSKAPYRTIETAI